MVKNNILNTILFIILFVNFSIAQSFSEGTFKTELLSYRNSEITDSSVYTFSKIELENEMNLMITYKPDAIAIQKRDNSRIVIDLSKKLRIEFREVLNEKYYFIDSLIYGLSDLNVISYEDSTILNTPTLLKSYKFGLDCWKYYQNENGSEVQILASSQIGIPKLQSSELDSSISSIVVESTFKDSLGNILAFGITSFIPKISDATVFSVDTTGYKNGALLKE